MRIPILFCLCLMAIDQFGQSTARFKNDLGFNVTTLLSEVIGVGNQGDNPIFNITYRRKGKTSSLRVSAHLGYNEDQSTNEIDFSVLTLKESDYRIRLGYEKRIDLSNRFQMHFGLDGLGLYSTSNSISTTGLTNDIKEFNFGGGPALRLEYKLSDRISLMTESTLYFLAGRGSDVLSLNGQQLANEQKITYKITTQIPSVLFLNVHF